MSKRDKLLSNLEGSRNDWSHGYDEIRALLLHYGYRQTKKGGCHVRFTYPGMPRSLTLTSDSKGRITFYQARDVREEFQRRGIL